VTPVPILLVGDGPDRESGLARILRDLASVLVTAPLFRVATLGYKATGSSRLPFQQYAMSPIEDTTWALQGALPMVWPDFSRGVPGIIMTIWDPTRLMWLARPDLLTNESWLKDWIMNQRFHNNFKLWGYMPLDAEGPHHKLTAEIGATLLGFDRLLACSPFGEQVIMNTIGAEQAFARGLTWLPHGNAETFR
jgi:hypothetical protein